VLLGGDLPLGEVFLGDGVDRGVDGFDAEFDRREGDGFGLVEDEDVVDAPGREAGGGNADYIFAGRDGGEGESAGAVGGQGAGEPGVGLLESDPGVGDGGAVGVGDGAGNGAGGDGGLG
jgi:hypothetical protein